VYEFAGKLAGRRSSVLRDGLRARPRLDDLEACRRQRVSRRYVSWGRPGVATGAVSVAGERCLVEGHAVGSVRSEGRAKLAGTGDAGRGAAEGVLFGVSGSHAEAAFRGFDVNAVALSHMAAQCPMGSPSLVEVSVGGGGFR